MACLNCDHTMQAVGSTYRVGYSAWWCPRCGALKRIGHVPEFEVPTNNHLWSVLYRRRKAESAAADRNASASGNLKENAECQ